MDYSHSHPEDLDFVFRYINRYQNSDKSLEDILSKLTADYPEFSGFITRLLEEQGEAEKWFADLIENIDVAVASEDFFAPGDRLGPYRIIEQIERGGMSQVYLAERSDGEFEQKVAVKVMDAHLDEETLVGFFRQEKAILAKLNHPNVAQIFDGGLIPSGHPYCIMEYVEGVPVDEYVTLHDLSLRQRLDIIVTICKAISFAHKNLIIHKDIKPQNVFVDKNGHVKLLDFGVADSLSSPEQKSIGSDTLFVTKKYASPEMLRKEPVNISSDIYQLGLVAYKILTGLHPKDSVSDKILFPSDFKKYGGRVKAHLPSVGEIDGELEAILRKALKENPDERYDSVFGMQLEIENYIADKPVETYSNTAPYLIAKFIKRNKTLVRTTGLFIAVLVVISIFYITNLKHEKNRAEYNAVLARNQAERSAATINYLKALIYKADPFSDGKLQSSSLMDSMAMMAYRQLEKDFTAQPKTKADIYIVLADIFRSRERFQKSYQALFEAQRLINMEGPSNDDQQARVWYNLAETYIHDGKHIDSARYHIDKAIAIDSLNPGVSNNRLSYELETLGRICAIEGKYDSAIRFYSQSLSRLEQQEGRENEITKAGTMSMLGEIYMRQSHYARSRELLQESLRIHTKYLGERNGYVVNDINKLANLYLKLNH